MTALAPSEQKASPRKLVTMTADLAWRVDEFRWSNRIGTESEALRQIIKAGLDALKVKEPPT